MNRFFIPALLLLLFCHGCASPPHRELEAARAALSEAYAGGAAELAPARYRTAREVLENSEAFMADGQYRRARETLPYAETLARQATEASHEEQKRRAAEALIAQTRLQGLKERLREEAKPQPSPMIIDPKPSRTGLASRKAQAREIAKGNIPPASDTIDETIPKAPLPSTYTVTDGETLWIIAAKKEIYQDPLLWPLLYRANRDQIKDPRRVYGGQTLSVPRNQSESDLAEARASARESDAFPIDPPMNAVPAGTP